jgi:hypothetical protein
MKGVMKISPANTSISATSTDPVSSPTQGKSSQAKATNNRLNRKKLRQLALGVLAPLSLANNLNISEATTPVIKNIPTKSTVVRQADSGAAAKSNSKLDKLQRALSNSSVKDKIQLNAKTIKVNYNAPEFKNLSPELVPYAVIKEELSNNTLLKNTKLPVNIEGTKQKCDAATAIADTLVAFMDSAANGTLQAGVSVTQQGEDSSSTLFTDVNKKSFCQNASSKPAYNLNLIQSDLSASGSSQSNNSAQTLTIQLFKTESDDIAATLELKKLNNKYQIKATLPGSKEITSEINIVKAEK